jgi:SAM-dependent methyltransferase
MAGGPDADRERDWLSRTQYQDILEVASRHLSGRRVIDIGCGTGDFVAFLSARGLEAHGIEPSIQAVEVARGRGLSVTTETIEGCADAIAAGATAPYDMVSMLCVLEHIPDPRAMLATVRRALVSDGVLCVKVPNDFSILQRAAQTVNGAEDWWVAVPDHVNYFSADSLTVLLEKNGFRVRERFADFPMELFILMGRDYVSNPALGRECHERRRSFELAMDGATRRDLYSRLAETGLGRNVVLVAEVVDQ